MSLVVPIVALLLPKRMISLKAGDALSLVVPIAALLLPKRMISLEAGEVNNVVLMKIRVDSTLCSMKCFV